MPLLKEFGKEQGISSGSLILGVVAAILFICVLMGSTDIIMNCIVALYPALQTNKALRTENAYEEHKFWLKYWMILGVVISIESLFQFILKFIPGYKLVKLCFFVLLMS